MNIIQCIDHGVYGVEPEDIPLCPICYQPMYVGEDITLQTCDVGSFGPDLLRIIHLDCGNEAEEGDDDDE